MTEISEDILDSKSQAIARYVGWKAADSLLNDQLYRPWREWFRSENNSENPPGVLRIDVKDFDFDEGTDESSEITEQAATLMVRAFVNLCDAGVRGERITKSKFEEHVVGACADTYLLWNAGSMQGAKQLDAREDGNIVFAVGDVAEGTLNAVDESLEIAWPESPEVLFRDWFGQGMETGDEDVITAANRLGYLADQLDVSPRKKKRLARSLPDSERPEWLRKSDDDAWFEDFLTLYKDAGLSSSQVDQFDGYPPSKKDVRTIVEGETDESSGETSTSRSRTKVDDWLTDRLREDERWSDEPDVAVDELDSGLRKIFEDWRERPWKMGSPIRFAEERLAACLEHLEARNDRDFENLAPVPDLGVKRSTHDAPVPPILDAVWATRQIRDCFPGRLGTDEDADLRLTGLSFSLYRQDEGDEQPRRPDWENSYKFYEDGHETLPLREFGLDLLNQLEDESRVTQSAQFFVCFEFDGEQRARVPVAFPWRLDDENSKVARAIGEPGDDDTDATRFLRVQQQLDAVVGGDNLKDGGQLRADAFREEFDTRFQSLRQTLGELQSSWEAYQEIERTGKAIKAGLHERLGPDDACELWPEAEQFIEAYRDAVEGFSELFGEAGDHAPRLAAGPLDEFMDFGLTSYETDDGDERVRIMDYHPLRLALFADLEREAHRELREMLDEPSTLQEIPVSVIPATNETPAVVWPPTGSDEQESEEGQIAGERREFLVPRHTDGAGFFSQDFSPFGDPDDREPDLIEPLRPLFRAWAENVFPGMKRRTAVALHSDSDTDHGLQTLRLCADLVGQTDRSGVVQGIDLQTDDDLGVPATVSGLSKVSREGDELDAVARALTEQRSNDPKFPLEVFSTGDDSDSEGLEVHVTLLVRPWQRQADWVVRDGAAGNKTPRSMVWDDTAQSWDAREAPPSASGDVEALSGAVESIEQRYQELLIRRWRGEADKLPRVLGQSLEASPIQPQGREMKQAHEEAADQSLRVVIADSIFGAEAIDDIGYDDWQSDTVSADGDGNELRVTYAAYHRNDNAPDWRITVLGSRAPEAEKDATETGLRALYDAGDDRNLEALAEQVYEATHRALPRVLREIWTADAGAEMRGELIGHLGVGLLASARREAFDAEGLPTDWSWLAEGFSDETILLSMDSLQGWTWTRRGGTRGDFLAVTPLGNEKVRLVAIESKGSRGTNCYSGADQARATARKLKERFGANADQASREEERRELLRVLAREAFRARDDHREVFERIAEGGADALEYEAVCVSTARNRSEGESPMEVTIEGEDDREVAWLKVRGLQGLEALVSGD